MAKRRSFSVPGFLYGETNTEDPLNSDVSIPLRNFLSAFTFLRSRIICLSFLM